jgi:hypothetical protein
VLNRFGTEDESWVHHYQPESERASVQLKHPSPPSTEKVMVTPSAEKIIFTAF